MATLKFKNQEGQWEVAETPCALKYTEQNLTEEQKAQARANIGVTEDDGKAIILNSSTTGSTKRFKITVDDSGKLTATEI